MKVYKVRNGKGEYARAGSKWGARGKIWARIQDVKAHLKLAKLWNPQTRTFRYLIPADLIVEEYELVKINEYNARELCGVNSDE